MPEDVAQKFLAFAEPILGAHAERIVELVSDMDDLERLGPLTALLTPAPGKAT